MDLEIKELNIVDEIWGDNEFDFCISYELGIGENLERGGLMFKFEVVGVEYLKKLLMTEEIILGRHYIIMKDYDVNKLENRLNKIVTNKRYKNWDEVISYLSKFFRYEFE